MNLNELKEYVRIVYEMELSVFQQKRLIDELESKISTLATAQPVSKPTLDSDAIYGVILWSMVCIFSIILIPLIIGIVLLYKGINALLGYCRSLKDNKDKKAYYNNAVTTYNLRMQRESEQKSRLLEQLEPLKKKYQSSCKLLEYIYSANVIYPKYRGLVPISSIYDYLLSGVCTQLAGHEGAYNKYDLESRLNMIITRLDTIIAQLDQIKHNQHMLYCGITESNRINSQLVNSFDRMQENVAIQAHETRLVRKELEYRNYMLNRYGR